MPEGRWITPNEMIHEASEHMLDGRTPQSRDDWMLVINFVAFNVPEEMAMPSCLLLAVLFEMPVTEEDVEEIVQFQLARRDVN